MANIDLSILCDRLIKLFIYGTSCTHRHCFQNGKNNLFYFIDDMKNKKDQDLIDWIEQEEYFQKQVTHFQFYWSSDEFRRNRI